MTSPSSPAPSERIDCQTHLFCPGVVELLETRTKDPRVVWKDGMRHLFMGGWLRKIPPYYMDVDAKLASMDAAGVTLAALSINDPGPEWFGSDGPAVARMMNDFVAETVSAHPTRFFGLCVLPFPDVASSLRELDRCADSLGMKGVLLYSNLAGRFADEPEFRPVLARAAALGLPVLLHPAKPLTTDVVKDYEMTSSLGNMFENTIALNRIIMSGMLDELPSLKVVCPHVGGALPYIIGRIDHQVQVLKRGPRYLKKPPSEYLKQIWFDVVTPLPLAIKFCRDFAGPDRMLYASDHPWVEPSVITDSLERAGLTPAEVEAIYSTNARRLFGL